ncbi:Nucleotide-binding oligomerization domain-containing protein 1 [Hondaea fermentalgiana]|uniref:Nucleotide-binding oligomerization domain-containing protein 1 n=1 Tax=Hondaea fermentalgiana TaxID=2315210 RepID=A0A2R5GFV6_9STRA|nr:Nucleotide-binding oligomerization domain-containing protein 1 [Hondaea fermentalgiana]|eukprot:GBG29209.1 Nucleotide-binding oligomerization domain-containing protein 1 [Hondaea fermentalgiana]
MVLQIGDWPVHSLEEANSAVHDTEFGSFVAVHILRGGTYARRSSSRASLGTATAAAAMFAAATQQGIDPNLEAEIHNNNDNGDDDNETDASRAARRKRTLLQKAKTEKERIFRESKSRYERKVEALGAANASPFMSEFITGCTELLSSPEVDLLCTVRDAFAGTGIQSRLPRIAQDKVTASSTAAGAGAAAAPAISGQTASIDLVSLKEVNPIQLYVLFCTLARHLDAEGSLETCSEVLINFGWRPIDRLSLHGLSVLLAKENVVTKIKIQAEDIDTTKDCCLLKPCLHGAPFARAVCTTAPMMLRLRQVCLASSTLDDDYALDLVAAFRACPCLQTLDLRRNRFGVGMARELGTAIADLECGMRLSLETLDLSWNELGGEGVEVLCTLLADAETVSLAELRVAFNGVTDDCAEAVRKLLEKNTLERLQKIDLSCNRLSGAAGLHLAAGLRVNTTVTDMSVSYNALGLDATLQIVASVIDSPVLATLWIENTTSDVSVQAQEGMVFESDSGERAPTFCDGLVQFTWELKEHMNLLRQYRCKEAIEVHVEYPEQLRHLIGGLRWYSPYLGAGGDALDGDGAESENSHLDLANSIFKDRAKEGDSRAFFDTLPVAEASMYTDWQFLEPKLQRFIKDEDKVRGLQEVVNAAYLELHNVHRYYSALGNDHDCIGFNEFMEVVFECQISDASCPDNAAQQAFVAANVELKAESKQEQKAMEANPDNALCLYEFIEALMRLALRKFGDEKKSTRIATSPREAFIWLLVDNIFPRCKRIRSNAFRRDKLYYYDVTVVLSTYRLKIDRLWKEYAGVTGANLLMKKDHWLEMLAATGVSRAAYTQGDRKRGTLYSPLALRLAFWSAQTMDRNRLVRNVRDRARNTSDALSYTEFLEALVWLADALQQDAALVELGLPADAFLSEKLICLLEMLLGSKCTNCFSRASYPALLADLRSKHEPMIYPERADYIFEASVATLNLEGATSEPESDVMQSP